MKMKRLVSGLMTVLCIWMAQPAQASDPYSLYQMTDGKVMRISTGLKGEKVQLLANPQFQSFGGATVPFAPLNPVWTRADDGTYRTLLGTTYHIHDSKIATVSDRNGHDITQTK